MKRFAEFGLWGLVAILVGSWGMRWNASVGDSYPTHPVQIVVPYSAGGGTDNFARLLVQAIQQHELLPQPVVVINQPGGSGTIGSRFVKDARPDGYRILCHHESIITAQLSGSVGFGPEDFEPIALTGENAMLIVVRGDAPWETVLDLLNDAQAEPNSIRFGANLGSPAHFTAMQLQAQVPGAQLNLITSGGGQKRFLSMLGGHIEAGIFTLAEFKSFHDPDAPPEQNVRVLVQLAAERHPALPGVPTCSELGLPVVSSNGYYWWAPRGTPDEALDCWAQALEQAMLQPEVEQKLETWSIGPRFFNRQEVGPFLQQRVANLGKVSVTREQTFPNFPLWLGLVVLGLAIGIGVLDRPTTDPATAKIRLDWKRWRIAAACVLVLIVYVMSLEFAWLPFAWSTSMMVGLLALLVSEGAIRPWRYVWILALLAGFGSDFLFTQIFSVALP